MSIWGKVIGGVAGFSVGGPLGAILGVAAGHAYDKSKQEMSEPGAFSGGINRQSKQVAFTTAVIVLGAKMAKADGQVTPDEVKAFKQVFQIPARDMSAVGRVFDEAKQDPTGFEPYAEQIAGMFRFQPQILEDLLGGLFHIAKADGVIHAREMEFLENVARIFGFDAHAFERLKSIYLDGQGDGDDPYAVLEVDAAISDDDLKKAYRKLIRENHPDKLMAEGLPEEFIKVANEKMAAINAAYDRICKQRGIK